VFFCHIPPSPGAFQSNRCIEGGWASIGSIHPSFE
jgi:hypothetical protein